MTKADFFNLKQGSLIEYTQEVKDDFLRNPKWRGTGCDDVEFVNTIWECDLKDPLDYVRYVKPHNRNGLWYGVDHYSNYNVIKY